MKAKDSMDEKIKYLFVGVGLGIILSSNSRRKAAFKIKSLQAQLDIYQNFFKSH